MKLIGSAIIVYSNYIGTIWNGLILNITPKELNPFLLVKMMENILISVILY